MMATSKEKFFNFLDLIKKKSNTKEEQHHL